MHTTFARIFGVIFILAGIIGFFANPIIGPEGILRTGILDNSTHIILGFVLLFSFSKARIFLRGIGIFLLIFATIGFMTPGEFTLFNGLMRMNTALDIAGTTLGILFVGVSYIPFYKT